MSLQALAPRFCRNVRRDAVVLRRSSLYCGRIPVEYGRFNNV